MSVSAVQAPDADRNEKSSASIVCPCCPLHCDDLSGDELSTSPAHCALAYERLKALRPTTTLARRDDEEREANERVLRVLSSGQRIVITGRVLDLATARAVVTLRKRAAVDVCLTTPNPSSQSVMKRDGSYTCTLGELTRPTNSLLIIGDVELAWPRIPRHLTSVRELAQLEDSPALLDQLAALRLAASATTAIQLPAELDHPALQQACELVRQASYLVILVAPLREDAVVSPLIWSALGGLVQVLNRQRRAALLTLDETYTLRATAAARLEQVPVLTSTSQPAVQIHLDPFAEPYERQAELVVRIGAAGPMVNDELFLPASTPGVDTAGIVYRGDGSVALPLIPWQVAIGYPSPADRLQQWIERL